MREYKRYKIQGRAGDGFPPVLVSSEPLVGHRQRQGLASVGGDLEAWCVLAVAVYFSLSVSPPDGSQSEVPGSTRQRRIRKNARQTEER